MITNRVPDDAAENIARCIQDGIPSAVLARQFGVGETTMLRFLAKHGISASRGLPPEAHDRVVQAYLQGQHSTTLAKQYGVTPQTVTYLLKARGVRIRSRAETNRMRAPIDDAELTRLMDEAILTQYEIAAHFGVSHPTIVRAVRRLSLKSKKGRGLPLEKNYFWQGGKQIEREGYVLVKAPDHPYRSKAGYVREHRLVMEQMIGRYLRPEEEVHHKDGDPTNNHADNLQLFANHAEHMRHHWLQEWHARYQGPPEGGS